MSDDRPAQLAQLFSGFELDCSRCQDLFTKYMTQQSDTERLTAKRETFHITDENWARYNRFVERSTQLEAHRARTLILHVTAHLKFNRTTKTVGE